MTVVLIPLAVVGIVALMAAVNALGIVTSLVAAAALVVLPGAGLARLLVPALLTTVGNQVAASLGLGLSLAVIVGVALDLTTIGVEHAPTVMTAAAILSAIALVPAAAREMLRWQAPAGNWPRQAALTALAAVLVTGAYAGARFAAERQGPAELTQLWILPSSGDGVRIGVTNVGTSAVEWRLVVREGDEVLVEEGPIDLQPDESWEITINAPRRAIPVTASLFQPDDVRAAHEVTLASRIR